MFAFGQITHTLLEEAPPAIADAALEPYRATVRALLEGLSAGSRRPG